MVINYDYTSKGSYTELAVGLFTFSYSMGGINFVDMAYITHSHIIDNCLIYTRTNAAAESFNAKVKEFRRVFRGIRDIKFFLFRLCKIYA